MSNVCGTTAVLFRSRRVAWIVTLALLGLGACGGGGGAENSNPNPVTPPTPIAPSPNSPIAVPVVLTTITIQPQSASVLVGDPVTFTVAASGDGHLSYQWQRNGVDLVSATAASYSLVGTLPSDTGSTWTVKVSNSAGAVTSASATLNVKTQTGTISSATPDLSGSLDRFGGLNNFPKTYQAIDSGGNIYVANGKSILKVTLAGVTSVLVASVAPTGLAVDAEGTVYFLDLDYQRAFFEFGTRFWGAFLRKISPSGEVSTVRDVGLGSARNLSIDAAGNFYWQSGGVDTDMGAMNKLSRAGAVTTIEIKNRGLENLIRAKSGDFYGTISRVIGRKADNSFEFAASIVKISPRGETQTLAGSDVETGTKDGLGGSARFGELSGLAVDSVGNVYVADTSYSTIRKIRPNGFTCQVAGTAGADNRVPGIGSLPGTLPYLVGLVMGADDVLYATATFAVLKIQFKD